MAKKNYVLGLLKKKKKEEPKKSSSIPDVNKDGKIDAVDFNHYRLKRGRRKTGMYKDTKPASTVPTSMVKKNQSYHMKKKNYAMMKKMKGYSVKKKKQFPDLNKDGKVTKADILMGRGVAPAQGRRPKRDVRGEMPFNTSKRKKLLDGSGKQGLYRKKGMSIAVKSNPELWNRMKAKAKAKMGGKHSARAMQLATRMYQKAGGGYRGNKPK